MAVVASELPFQVGLQAEHQPYGVLGLQPLQVDLQLASLPIDLAPWDPLQPLGDAAQERSLPQAGDGGRVEAD